MLRQQLIFLLMLYEFVSHKNRVFYTRTPRVKGNTRIIGKYVTGLRKRFRSYKVYIFLMKITIPPC